MFKKWILTMVCCVLLAISGCVKTVSPTGETQYSIDPNRATQIEEATETAASIMVLLGVLWPVLIPIAAGTIGALGAWKKIKPQLTEAQSEANLYHTTTHSIVTAVEDFKKAFPDQWVQLETKLHKAIGKNAENVIRALRGLSPKE